MTAHVEVLSITAVNQPRYQPGLYECFSRFRREERGSILILSLFIFLIMFVFAGLSVDLVRSETQRALLQSTLDRAVLAGASLEQSLDSEAVVRDHFEKAGLTKFLTSVVVVEDANSKTVTATADAFVGTYFINMLGIDSLTSPAGGQAEESLSDIEISLILDISGSMGWWSNAGNNSKLNLLKVAAKDFVHRMQCNPDDPTGTADCTVEENSVSISLVPYAEQVLVGESLIQNFNVGNEHNYSSCADFDQTDFSSSFISLNTPLKRAAAIDVKTGYSSRNFGAQDHKRSCRTNSYRKIVPLSNSYTTLQSKIQALEADGYTSIDVGMKWGTALLSPEFRPAVFNMANGFSYPAIINEFANRPFEYDERSMQKVIVLMTDGENTNQYVIKDQYRSGPSPIYKNSEDGEFSAFSSSRNQYYYPHDDTWNDTAYGDGTTVETHCSYTRRGNPYNCYTTEEDHPGYASQINYEDLWEDYRVNFYKRYFDGGGNFLPSVYNSYGNSSKNTRLNAICTAAKANGVEIFTIGFETSDGSNAIMQNCATNTLHHFDVDGGDLDDAFTSIAREIHKLRLTL